MSKRDLSALAGGLLCALLLITIVSAQGGVPLVNWWVIAGGGAPSIGGDVTFNDTVGQPVIGPATGGDDIALNAGYWARCVAVAAVMPVVTVTRSVVDVADVVLTWDADSANVQYQVWVSTDPYLDPDGVTPTTVTAAATYTDPGAAGSTENHFYVVRGLNACGAASANSKRKGEFTFSLTPGG